MIDPIATFRFPVGRGFLGPRRQITIRQTDRPAVHAAIGWVKHTSVGVDVINAEGVMVTGSIRHGVNNHTDYLQIQSTDPQVTAGLILGQTITVEIHERRQGLLVHLLAE